MEVDDFSQVIEDIYVEELNIDEKLEEDELLEDDVVSFELILKDAESDGDLAKGPVTFTVGKKNDDPNYYAVKVRNIRLIYWQLKLWSDGRYTCEFWLRNVSRHSNWKTTCKSRWSNADTGHYIYELWAPGSHRIHHGKYHKVTFQGRSTSLPRFWDQISDKNFSKWNFFVRIDRYS